MVLLTGRKNTARETIVGENKLKKKVRQRKDRAGGEEIKNKQRLEHLNPVSFCNFLS